MCVASSRTAQRESIWRAARHMACLESGGGEQLRLKSGEEAARQKGMAGWRRRDTMGISSRLAAAVEV